MAVYLASLNPNAPTPEAQQAMAARLEAVTSARPHGASPDNLARVSVEGIANPVNGALEAMPGFAHSLNDQQLTDLIRYLRTRQARMGRHARRTSYRPQMIVAWDK